ncbi:hypothetical protein OIDMADRAFT_55692 [Oidiodendron maius Zn]|uniref:FAD/NAD(P)-binding domain-containing protein n=1 Tax=Oidiodendron maius (strain Zn) TaxID=913774 RepID=A0A0C3CLC4_OIDMZ|nr:hypothetical protein OIDMADRAFT_55692 [Oidiodendron maius Zn]
MSATHNIVVLGGNVAGLSISHYILRHIVPAADKETGKQYKLSLVSPSTHYQHKVGAPRALSQPDLVDKVFVPLADSFAGYGSKLEHVQGEAVALEPSSKRITVSGLNDSRSQVTYDSLIIATGVRSASPLWTLHGQHTISADALHETSAAIDRAKTILIAGGGATGVETAGEIGSHWRGKDVTILSGSTQLLANLKDMNVGKKAETQLHNLNVKTEHMTKVTSASKTAEGKMLLMFNNGTTREVDVYIDATGGTPNTSFLPTEWLDSRGKVNTDVATLRGTGAAGVYAIGDVASYSKSNILDIHRAVAPLGYSLWADLTKGSMVKTPLAEKLYKQDQTDFGAIPVGPSGGVGTALGWSLPSFMVKFIKSKTFLFDKVPGIVGGSPYQKIDVGAMPNY